MLKTTYYISKMDCPSEEQLIRMALSDIESIRKLEFDIAHRKLVVFHTNDDDTITQKLKVLNLGAAFEETLSVEYQETHTDHAAQEKKLLWQVLIINVLFFALELITGFVSQSMGLVADSMDMLADSIVYSLALLAAYGIVKQKKNVAKAAGFFQLILAVFGFVEVLRRFVFVETMPDFQTMIVVSVLALLGNSLCLYLLQKSKSSEAHVQASMIFTSNDVIVNLGVICAATLVYFTHSKYPDMIVGAVVFVLVARASFAILKLAK